MIHRHAPALPFQAGFMSSEDLKQRHKRLKSKKNACLSQKFIYDVVCIIFIF